MVAVAAGLLAGTLGAAPQVAAAPSGTKCADLYRITKPTPPRNQLPGFNGQSSTPNTSGRTYDYRNPGETARNLELPSSQRELLRYGVDTTGKTPGTKEHVFAAWNRYLARKQAEGKKPLSWEKWRNLYVPNMGNDARGKAFERLLAENIGLGGPDWCCQDRIPGGDPTRKYDAVNHREKIAYEFKSGCGTDTVRWRKTGRTNGPPATRSSTSSARRTAEP